QNRTVKVILQSDDLADPQLVSFLKKEGVVVVDRADSLGMMTIEMPPRIAERLAELRGAQHMSLDRPIESLGHIETTTGASLIRTMTNTVLVGGLLNTVTSQLDGTGVGVAVLDSGIYEQHHSFIDSSAL